MKAHLIKVGFGRHANDTWDKVPNDYLRWVVRTFEGKHEDRVKYAKEILKSRNAKVGYNVTLTAHAIDRASQRLLHLWLEDYPNKEVGLYEWFSNLCYDMLRGLDIKYNNKNKLITADGICIVVALSGDWPVVITTFLESDPREDGPDEGDSLSIY